MGVSCNCYVFDFDFIKLVHFLKYLIILFLKTIYKINCITFIKSI